MRILISADAVELGARAAEDTARLMRDAIAARGNARLLVSTGKSQFTLLEALCRQQVDWTKVSMFHLDEYLGMSEAHPASFVRYLKDRFVCHVPLKRAYFVDGEADPAQTIANLTRSIQEQPIDVGLIGIGENAHIAFNDPPADFGDQGAYKIVTLDARCRAQQLGEGWFASIEDVPKQAISMTVSQILRCRHILCAVPYKVKAEAIRSTVEADQVTNMIPATALRQHPDVTLYLDRDSAGLLQ